MAIPGTPREHMDALLRLVLPFARDLLEAHGDFYPFAASMRSDGELATVAAPGQPEQPDPDDLLADLYGELRTRADSGLAIATAVCSNVTINEGDWPEGIRVELEHRDADPLTCVLPYGPGDAGLSWGQLLAMPGERRAWPPIDHS